MLKRINRRLWGALAGLSMIYVATTAAVVGDATDFLGLGSQPVAESSEGGKAKGDGTVLTAASLTDNDLANQDDDEPSDTNCMDQIRTDVGQGSLIQYLGQSGAPFPNARTEYYRATTTSGEHHYACTIVLPDQITLARLGSRPVTGTTAPAATRGASATTAGARGKS